MMPPPGVGMRPLRFDHPARLARLPRLLGCMASLFCLFLLPLASPAQQTLSAPLEMPLSDPIGDSVYAESDLTGPSSAIVPGGNNLLDPSLHTGTSDPLSFLIESGLQSPYNLGGSLVNSYMIDSYVNSQVIADTTVAARFSEYRDNRALMSGTARASNPGGRAGSAGGLLQGSKSTTMTVAAASGGFGSLTLRAPFAAGSTLLAGRQSASPALSTVPNTSPGTSTFADPNALVLGLSSSTGQSSMQGENDGDAMGDSSDEFGTVAGISPTRIVPVSTAMPVTAASSMGTGLAPGSIFPNVGAASPSATGFPDSTKGTAGLPYEVETATTSPLAVSYSDASEGPFRGMSAEGTSFLNPTLTIASGAGTAGEEQAPVSLEEVTRKLRMHAMIYNPGGSPLPSPFQQRAMQKDYLRAHSRHHVSHYPTMTAPAVTP